MVSADFGAAGFAVKHNGFAGGDTAYTVETGSFRMSNGYHCFFSRWGLHGKSTVNGTIFCQLTDANRVRVVALLAWEELCVGDIQVTLDYPMLILRKEKYNISSLFPSL